MCDLTRGVAKLAIVRRSDEINRGFHERRFSFPLAIINIRIKL